MTGNSSVMPSWIHEKLFHQAVREVVGDFQMIVNFKVVNALEPGENYATLMLRVQIDVLLPDNSLRTPNFMLKVAHAHKFYREEMSKFKMFQTEAGMYRNVVPELEQLYREKGVEIRFGAKAYTLPVADKECEYILLEDLSQKGFRNVKRQDCLDWEHTKCCLKKLAQWHAASAVRVAQKGAYSEQYLQGFLAENCRQMTEQMFSGNRKYVLAAARKLPHHEQYYEKLETLLADFTNVLFAQAKFDANDFNVLNHGDFWCNNIMFQHDPEGNITETYFVDFQMPRYCSPAQDLWYFILSSTRLDFKIQRFDEMINFYHRNLIDNLKILQYSKPFPCLRDLHKRLLDMGSWALMTITCIMAGVLCDPTDMAKIDNFVQDSAEGDKFKSLLYFNKRFSNHFEVLLPWLNNRGALDCLN